jgi:hypothetical protein
MSNIQHLAKAIPIHPAAVQTVVDRLKEANEPNVLPRPLEEYERAAKRGILVALEVDGRIEAVSGIFDLGLHVNTHMEAGGTFVSQELRGFGIQDFWFQLRFAMAVIQIPNVNLITAIKPTNTQSLKNSRKNGFISWSSPIQAVYEPCIYCDDRGKRQAPCCCDYYILPASAHKLGVANFLKLPPVFSRTRGTSGLTIDMRGLLVATDADLREDLRNFAR